MMIYEAFSQNLGNKVFNTFYSPGEQGFEYVSAKSPCTICHKPDWCSRTKDGRIGLCKRVEAGCFGIANNGAYKHFLNADGPNYRSARSAVSQGQRGTCGTVPANSSLASPQTRHEVYTGLLESLTLRSEHSDNLLNERGLSDTTVAYNLYASAPLPEDSRKVSQQMRERYGDVLRGVPGFYRPDNGLWRFRAFEAGFFIPFRNVAGQIVGLQIRRDGAAKPKYLWVATPPDRYKNGTSSRSPFHYVKPDLANHSGTVVIIEGALKADCVAQYTHHGCVAIAGVCVNSQKLITELKESFPALKRVVVAFDADWHTNKAVENALVRLLVDLDKNAPWATEVWEWEPSCGKGLDDALLNAIQGGK